MPPSAAPSHCSFPADRPANLGPELTLCGVIAPTAHSTHDTLALRTGRSDMAPQASVTLALLPEGVWVQLAAWWYADSRADGGEAPGRRGDPPGWLKEPSCGMGSSRRGERAEEAGPGEPVAARGPEPAWRLRCSISARSLGLGGGVGSKQLR